MKHVSVALREPSKGKFNTVSCFGDNKTARIHPDWVVLSEKGGSQDLITVIYCFGIGSVTIIIRLGKILS